MYSITLRTFQPLVGRECRLTSHTSLLIGNEQQLLEKLESFFARSENNTWKIHRFVQSISQAARFFEPLTQKERPEDIKASSAVLFALGAHDRLHGINSCEYPHYYVINYICSEPQIGGYYEDIYPKLYYMIVARPVAIPTVKYTTPRISSPWSSVLSNEYVTFLWYHLR